MNEIIPIETPDFDLVIDAVLNSLESSGSKRVYAVTYQKWFRWCELIGLTPFALTGVNVSEFLRSQNCTKSTRSHYLAHLRKITEYLSIHIDGFDRIHKDLKFIKTPKDNLGGKERNRTALRPDEVYELLTHWDGDDATSIRNKAMIGLSLATGARRAEIVALEWNDINLDDGIVIIRHGKGDKLRESAIVGDFAITSLKRWRRKQGKGWQFIFVPVNKKGIIGPDKAIDPTTLYKAFRKASAKTQIEFSPHDLRRTLATELFIQGAMTSDVQTQLGHADSSTTNKYALAGDASQRRERFRTRWRDK